MADITFKIELPHDGPVYDIMPPPGSTSAGMTLPGEYMTKELILDFIDMFHLKQTYEDGTPVTYSLLNDTRGGRLDTRKPLEEAGLRDGDWLRIRASVVFTLKAGERMYEDISVPDDYTVGKFLYELGGWLNLPDTAAGGGPAQYGLLDPTIQDFLDEGLTLREQGVREGDVLVLYLLSSLPEA